MSIVGLGIDPGLKGGVALVSDFGGILCVDPLPYMGKAVDVRRLQNTVSSCAVTRAAVELQHARSFQAGAMTILSNYGRLLAVLEIEGLPFYEVTAPVWKRHFKIEAGLEGKAKKEASYIAAVRRWGADALAAFELTPAKDGQVEALMIATHAMEVGR